MQWAPMPAAPAEFLLIDNSNSFTKFALSSETRLGPRRKLRTREITPDSLTQILHGWKFRRVVMCSVVPEKSAVLAAHLAAYPVLTVSARIELGIGIDYPKPRTIGADRLANAVSATHFFGAPVVVVDFGTAVTFDIISKDRTYVGGVIAPGLEAMTDYLHQRTALLPRNQPAGAARADREIDEESHARGRGLRLPRARAADPDRDQARARATRQIPGRGHGRFRAADRGWPSRDRPGGSAADPRRPAAHREPQLRIESARSGVAQHSQSRGALTHLPQMTHAIGIDFGGTTIKSGLVLDGNIVARGRVIDTQSCGDADAIISALVEVVDTLRATAPAVGIGIGLPGIVDSVNGIVHELTNVAGWIDTPLRDIIQQRTGLATTIENDANAMAYGEWKYGAAVGAQHCVCITLGTGVGGALILNGQLYRGAQLGAGEVGHLSIDYQGLRGPYGNLGCLEEYVGNSQIAARAAQLYQSAGIEKTAAECSPLELDRAARAGDKTAQGLWNALGVELGAALSSVVWVLNPDTIVIGGGVAKAGDLLFEPIRQTIRERTIEVFYEKPAGRSRAARK